MWLPLTLLVIVGVAAADFDHAWKSGQEYHYLVRSRTFTGLEALSPQYSGIIMKAILTVQPQDPETLRAKVSKPQYAHVHKELKDWDIEISDQMLELHDMPMSGRSFDIKTKHGIIRDLITDRDVPTWEVNILKGIVSQLQVDTQAENAMRNRGIQAPGEQPFAMFRAMEDTVGGKCETLYDITPLSEFVLEEKPELVPMPHLKEDGQHIDIIKTKNYSRCEQRVGYHFGITGNTNWEPGSNQNGQVLSKSSNSRIVISGNLKKFTIQSSVTTNKMYVSPRLHDDYSGIVVSRMNLTLVSMKPTTNPLPSLKNPESVGNLVYTFNNPFSESEERRPGRPSIAKNSRESTNSNEKSTRSSEEAPRNGESRRRGDSSSSISSSEESEFWQPKPTLEEAPHNPLLPMFVGNKGKAIGMSDKINLIKETKDLIQQISNELEDASEIPNEQTLEKFTILTTLIRTMNRKQLMEIDNNLNLSPNRLRDDDKPDTRMQNAWSVFRDAVTQAGTGPAFLTIKDWIENQKVEGMEAAEMLSRLPKNTRTPTAEYVDKFFELAKNPVVQKQSFLNSTAMLSFAELVRHSQVSNSSIHNRYPVHTFGRLSSKHNQAVLQSYIPFLAQQLRNAIKDGDSPRIQTYIIALGNIAHPKILSVFEPYLEGKEQISTYQRTLMVAALSKLADLHPKLARSVLYKIYLNTMDTHEVRCTAVFLLMKTNPPLTMLQRMAEFTNYDTSKHVNSAVKTTIESLATLERPETRDLASRAKIAMYLLTPNKYNYQYSQGFVVDSNMGNLNLAYRLIVNYIGSDDGALGQAWYIGLDKSYGEFNAPKNEFQAMVSSISAIANMYLKREKEGQRPEKTQTEKIAAILKIEPEDPVQVEGHLLWNTKLATRFLSFDNHTLERIPEWISKRLSSMKNDGHFNMNRLMSYEVTMSFPTESGLPFIYSLKVPSLSKLTGKAKVQGNAGVSGTVNAEFRMLHSMKLQGRVGFITPFEHQQFTSGVDQNIQVYVPVKIEVALNIPKKRFELNVWPIKSENSARVFHYSTIPYTSKHDILSLRPIATDKNTQRVITFMVSKRKDSFPTRETTWIEITVENDGPDIVDEWDYSELLGFYIFPLSRVGDKYRKVDILVHMEDAPKSPLQLRVNVDSMQIRRREESDDSGEWDPKPMKLLDSDDGPMDESRRKQFLKEAAEGLNDGKAYVMDLRLATPGSEPSRSGLTVAWAETSNSDNLKTLVYWKTRLPERDIEYEVCSAARAKSNVHWFEDLESLKKITPAVEFNVDVRYGDCLQGGKLDIKGTLARRPEVMEKVENSDVGHKCEEQMKQGNKALRACREATDIAMTLNELRMSVDLHSPVLKMMIDKSVEALMLAGYSKMLVRTRNPEKQDKESVQLMVLVSEDNDEAFVTLATSDMKVIFPDIDLNPKFIESDFAEVDEGTCALDNTVAETFDGRAYPYQLGKCWHVVMTTFPKENPDNPNEPLRIPEDMMVSVLARETDNGKEVKILLGDDEVRLAPRTSHIKATVNDKKIEVTKERSFQQQGKDDEVVFEIFELPDGRVRLSSDRFDLNLLYDGKRIQLMASSNYRNSVRGLCGNYDSEPSNDFTTPKNCAVESPEIFLASYALTQEECKGPSMENIRKLEKSDCKRREVQMSDVINDIEAGRVSNPRRTWGYHTNQEHGQKRCNSYRTQVTEVDDKICFSTRPTPTCAPECRATETKSRNYEFHCMEKSPAALEMKKRIEKGANPDLSQKSVSLTRAIEVPLACRA